MEKGKCVEIERKGNIKTEIYIPSNYQGPIAIDCKPYQPERLSEKTLNEGSDSLTSMET